MSTWYGLKVIADSRLNVNKFVGRFYMG